MQIGSQPAGYGRSWPGQFARPEAEAQSRGERLVARLDADGDGKLGLTEIADSRLGRKMTVEQFERRDRNGDGALDAGELDRGRGRGRGWAWGEMRGEAMQNLVTAQMADYLTENVPAALPGEDLVNEVIARLDSDGSGALNSEEIAGTRLAERIGAGFYDLDGDRSGTLDTAELGAFVRSEILGLAEPAAPPPPPPAEAPEPPESLSGLDPVAGTEAGEEAAAAAPAEPPAEVVEAVEAGDPADTAAPDPAQAMLTAFETALQMIEDGQEARSTYDVVSALYGTAKDIFAV